jgi:hypothetical protein
LFPGSPSSREKPNWTSQTNWNEGKVRRRGRWW